MKIWLIALLFFTGIILADEYQVDRSKESIVKFISDAPIEEFEGVTDNIDGYIKLRNFEDLEESEMYFEVDLNTIDTGIGLRNRHMRENYLETDKYQYTFFQGKFKSIRKTSEENFYVQIEGKMFIHGITKSIEVSGNIDLTNTGFKVTSSFDVNLTDYNIEIPQMMFMKINEVMKIELNFNMERVN